MTCVDLEIPLFCFNETMQWYCWWTKSCTTKDDDYPIIDMVSTIPSVAGFLPSTVCTCFQQQPAAATVEDYDWKPLVQNSSSNRLTSRSRCQSDAITDGRQLKRTVEVKWICILFMGCIPMYQLGHGCLRLPFQEHGKGHYSIFVWRTLWNMKAGSLPVTRAMKGISQNYPTAFEPFEGLPHIYIWLMEGILHHQGCIKPSK